jgi:hypothetical protein
MLGTRRVHRKLQRIRHAGLIVLLGCGSLSAQSAAQAAGQTVAQPSLSLAAVPAGIYLPVQLGHTLTAGKVPVGAGIIAKTTQPIPLGDRSEIAKGARLFGEILASAKGDGTPAQPAILQFRFTRLEDQQRTIPVRLKAVAIANFTDVADAGTPILNSVSRGNSGPANWTTRQVGGDEVFRQLWVGGLYDTSMRLVGSADEHGVYTLPQPLEDNGSRPLPRALGVFSASAAGLYGFGDGCTLRSDDGTITVTRVGKTVKVRNGDDLLLETIPSKQLNH